jgi:rod shape-determining protein MreD
VSWPRFAVLVCLATVTQAGVIDALAVTSANVKPDLLLVLLVFFAVHGGASDAIITSFAIGFAADVIGPTMGPNTIGFGFFGTVLAQANRVIAIRKMPHQAAAIFVTGLLTAAAAHLLWAVQGRHAAGGAGGALLGGVLYSALVGPFLFLPAGWWMRIRVSRFRW